MEKYILKYITDNSENVLVKKYIDFLKVNLDGYFYGRGGDVEINYGATRQMTWKTYLYMMKKMLSFGDYKKCDNNVLSFVPLPSNIRDNYRINLLGSYLAPVGSKWICERELIKFSWFFLNLISHGTFNEIVSEKTAAILEDYNDRITKLYSKYNFKGLFIPHGEPFIYKLHMDIFRKLQCPSFIFLHGLPAIYNLETEKRADYLLVWGEKIRQNYIKVGFDANKVKVVGHPRFESIPHNISIRSGLDDVLVATTASNVWSPHDWDYKTFPRYDSSLLVLYCYSVQNVLKKLNVKHARLRLHPSVDKLWLKTFIDNSFYTIDTLPLLESLKRSSIVIGPTTTVCLESLINGVNYVVYELGDNNCDIHDYPLVPPFDGSDPNLLVVNDEESLYEVLKDGEVSNVDLLKDYIEPFNFSHVYKLLK